MKKKGKKGETEKEREREREKGKKAEGKKKICAGTARRVVDEKAVQRRPCA